jgi:hypothetical protein
LRYVENASMLQTELDYPNHNGIKNAYARSDYDRPAGKIN